MNDNPLSLKSIRQGVTEISLSDGRIIRASLHVKSIIADGHDARNLDVSYYVVSEIVDQSEAASAPHETVQ